MAGELSRTKEDLAAQLESQRVAHQTQIKELEKRFEPMLKHLDARNAEVAKIERILERPRMDCGFKAAPEVARLRSVLESSGLFFETSVLEECADDLLQDGVITLAGPPGNGKSQLAMHLPLLFIDDRDYTANVKEYITWVEAHSGLNESEIVGYEEDNGVVRYPVPGFFSKAALKCIESGFHWLFMDELNHADVKNAFGTLYNPLRNLAKGASFKIPGFHREVNVPRTFRLITAMNTADERYFADFTSSIRTRFRQVRIMAPGIELERKAVEFHCGPVLASVRRVISDKKGEPELITDEIEMLLDTLADIRRISEERTALDYYPGVSDTIGIVNAACRKVERDLSKRSTAEKIQIHVPFESRLAKSFDGVSLMLHSLECLTASDKLKKNYAGPYDKLKRQLDDYGNNIGL